MSNTIWLYWEGPMPAMISLYCKTVFAHNEKVVLLDRAGFDKLFVSDRDINREYWIATFAEAGFKLDSEATDGVRKSSTMWSGFTKHTGLVFVRQSE